MLSVDNLCMGCMAVKGSDPVCPTCGWIEGSDPVEGQQLSPRTILHGKYLAGRALGQGGFGITYIAWDLNLKRKLAVKEYFPAQLCTRKGETTVTALSSRVRDDYQYGLERFLDEGRTLAKLDHPGIVDVFDYFLENGTAYLVMKYLEGETLAHSLKNNSRLPFDTALRVLTPVMDALRAVHDTGLLHRDVSPDNIYLCHSGQVKLIDFGAARNATAQQSQNMSVILKQGYAPVEQYQSRGRQGPWTDVYGVAATFYHTVTGQKPPDAPERWDNDPIQKPSRFGVAITAAGESALMKGLAVRIEARFQDVLSFEKALGTAGPPVPPERLVNVPEPRPAAFPWKAAVAAILVLLLCLVWIIARPKPLKITAVKFSAEPAPLSFFLTEPPLAKDTTRHIKVEASFSRKVSEDTDIESVWTGPDNGIISQENQNHQLKSGQDTLAWISECCDDPGRWVVGHYSVDFRVNGKTVKNDEFEVKPSSAPAAPTKPQQDSPFKLGITPKPGPSNAFPGTAKIENVQDKFDKSPDGGITIYINFSTLNLQSEHLQVAVFFYFQDRKDARPDVTRGGRPVVAARDAPNKFRLNNGTLGVWDLIDSSLTRQPARQFFVPYSAFDLPPGMSFLKYEVQIRAIGNQPKVFDTWGARAFHVSRGQPSIGKRQGCCCTPGESVQACFLKCNALVPNCQ
jgi:serine/threonine protein kinase